MNTTTRERLRLISTIAQAETQLRALGVEHVKGPVCDRCGRVEKPWHPDPSCGYFFPYGSGVK